MFRPDVAIEIGAYGSPNARRRTGRPAIVGLVGALLLEQNDEWAVQRARYMTLETIAPMGDNNLVSLPAVADWQNRPGESR